MARSRVRYVDAPPRNDVYVGMLALAVFATLIGCAVLAIESDEYDWSGEAKAGPTLSLPTPSAPAGPSGVAPAPVTPPAGNNPMPMTPMGGNSQATPKAADPVALPPAPAVAANPPAPLPPVVPAENAATKPDAAPRPGFNLNLPRRP